MILAAWFDHLEESLLSFFQRHAKCIRNELFYKKNFPLNGQTKLAKLSSQQDSLSGAWPLLSPLNCRALICTVMPDMYCN